MIVKIKRFRVDMPIGNNGIEIDVSDLSDKHLGDLYVSRTGLIWCNGKIGRKSSNAKHITWDRFIRRMNRRKKKNRHD